MIGDFSKKAKRLLLILGVASVTACSDSGTSTPVAQSAQSNVKASTSETLAKLALEGTYYTSSTSGAKFYLKGKLFDTVVFGENGSVSHFYAETGRTFFDKRIKHRLDDSPATSDSSDPDAVNPPKPACPLSLKLALRSAQEAYDGAYLAIVGVIGASAAGEIATRGIATIGIVAADVGAVYVFESAADNLDSVEAQIGESHCTF